MRQLTPLHEGGLRGEFFFNTEEKLQNHREHREMDSACPSQLPPHLWGG